MTLRLGALLIWLVALGVGAWHASPMGSSVAAAVLGGVLGFVGGEKLAFGRLRTPVMWALAVVMLACGGLLASALVGTDALAALIGPSRALVLAEALLLFVEAATGVAVLRATARRHPPFLALEVTVVAAVLVRPLAAHRDGFLNRPYFLVDGLLADGVDPLPVFLAIGAGLAILLVVLAAGQGKRRANAVDVMLLCMAAAFLFLMIPTAKLSDMTQKPPSSPGASGSPKPAGGSSPNASGSPRPGGGSPRPATGTPNRQKDQDSPSYENASGGGRSDPAVAVVLFHDDYTPPLGEYYFRQTIFSQYNGRRMVRDVSGLDARDTIDAFPVGTVKLSPEADGRPLDTTVALLSEHNRAFGLITPVQFTSADNPDPKRFVRAYGVRSRVSERPLKDLLGRKAGLAGWDAATFEHYTAAPKDPRYKQLVEQILTPVDAEKRKDPLIRAAAIKMWLEENGTYNLESKSKDAEDPTTEFLFGDRTGYCVYFATAACYLYRTAGVPSRLAGGYAVDARDRGNGSSLLIRSRSSHEWPEIALQGAGWFPLDISPKKSLVPPQDPPDQGLQQMLGDMARQQPDRKEQMKSEQPPRRDVVRELLDSVAWYLPRVLLLLVALAYGLKAWRRVWPYLCGAATLQRVAYRGTLDRLADCGLLRERGMSREGFAREVAQVCPTLRELTLLNVEEAFAGRRPAASREKLLRLYAAAGREIAAEVPLKRRILGLINPLSWWRVR